MRPRYTPRERRSTGGRVRSGRLRRGADDARRSNRLVRRTPDAPAPLAPNRLFIVEQPGRVRLLKNGALQTTAFLDIRSKVESGGEQGLLSVAFHPDFETNGFFYVNYTSQPNGTIADGDTVVARYHVSPTADQADPLSEQLVFSVHQPFANHNGGLNLFGPDGMLYVGMGDGGSGGDPMGNGQSDASNLGKLLRV